ncbi:MAG: chaperone modulatory protein CbpM [Miltoncostaeaceae bacterium]|nr:chaperone modulatory protein CbpM [Miltoncostaeaceae bacterium]
MSSRRPANGAVLALRWRPAGALSLDELARAAGLHPELVRRLVRMGLVDPVSPEADLWPPAAAARLARAVRLRRDLGLNYAGALLASDLLERIEELEGRLRRYEEVRWIRTS